MTGCSMNMIGLWSVTSCPNEHDRIVVNDRLLSEHDRIVVSVRLFNEHDRIVVS